MVSIKNNGDSKGCYAVLADLVPIYTMILTIVATSLYVLFSYFVTKILDKAWKKE